MTPSTTSTSGEGLQNAAVFMRSPGSLESRPLKARETMMMKGAAVLTVSWAMTGEALDRGGVEGPQGPQTLEGHTTTSEPSG